MNLEDSLTLNGLQICESLDKNMRIRLLMPLPQFWLAFRASAEFSDGQTDPMDRYSKRIITPIAKAENLEAAFPSDGPPFPSFIKWALAANEISQSPLGLLVHKTHGLMVSFRGALIGGELVNAEVKSLPCANCAAPCKTACPVNAFENGVYNVEACKAHLASGDVACWDGCLARRSCLTNSLTRDEKQSRFHMHAFMG